MGALSGSMTATAYYVDGEIPKDFRTSYIERLTERRFREIDLASDQDEALGWVPSSNPFGTEFTLNDVVWNDYVLLNLRQDILRVPAGVFKMHLRKAIQDYCEEMGKEKPNKHEAENVRGLLERELRRKVLPVIRVFEAVWNMERRQLWFFTTNKRLNEIFQDMFTDTFGVTLIPRNAYSLLEKMDLSDERLAHAANLEPSFFAVPPGQT
jgi:hypothetical protein